MTGHTALDLAALENASTAYGFGAPNTGPGDAPVAEGWWPD